MKRKTAPARDRLKGVRNTHGGRAIAESVLSALIGQAILVVSGVLVARALGVTDRGHLALLSLIPSTLAHLGTLGMPVAVTYAVSQQPNQVRAIARSLILPATTQALPLVVIHLVVLISVLSEQSTEVRVAGAVTLLIIPVGLTHQYGLALLQGQQLFRHYNVLGLLAPALYSSAVIVLVILGAAHLVPVSVAWVLSYVAAGALTLVLVLRALPPSEPTGAIVTRGQLVKLGLKSFVASASPVQRFRLDQAVVGFLLSPAALGLYVVGAAFTSLISFVAQGIGAVGYPRVASIPDSQGRRRTLWRYFSFAMIVCSAAFAVLEVAAGWLVPVLFGEEFEGAVLLTRILLVAALLYAGRRVLVDLARGAGMPGYGTIAEVASWISLLPALVILTPMMGSSGVAWSMVVSAATAFAILFALVAVGMRAESIAVTRDL